MAFEPQNMAVLAYSNGLTVWHYRSGEDDHREILRAGYFDAYAHELQRGDLIVFGDAQSRTGWRQVVQAARGMVEVAPTL